MQETMTHFELSMFKGVSLTHLHKNTKKQCEITPLGTHLACQIHPVGHTMPHPPPRIWVHPHDQSLQPLY